MNREEELLKTSEYYKDLYEKERQKCADLTEKLVDAEAKAADLTYKMDKLRNSMIWKMVYPARLAWSHTKNLFIRIKRYGSISNLKKKIVSKIIERKAYRSYGTLSMPTPEEIKAQKETVFPKNILFSILVPLYNTPEVFLREMIDSVVSQTYENWELCLADGSDADHAYVEQIVKGYGDDRIRYERLTENLGISGNTNKCFEMAKGDYIGLFDHDDILHPTALYEYMKVICDKGADYIYCDETTFSGKSIDHMITLHFKPDFAPDNLRANNYICHFSVFSKELVDKCGTFRTEFDGSQDHDMILRLTKAATNIVHVPKILYYWRSHAGSVASDINAKSYAIDAAKGAVAAHLTACGFSGFKIESSRAFETIFRIRYALTGHPLVSILIPNKDHTEDLRRCIESITDRTSYDNYEIIVIENNSVTDEIKDYYETLKMHPRIKVVSYEGDFNYSAVNNFGASFAEGEYIILLNNDTEVITRNWIEELLMYAQRDDVGAVGCMLYYPDYTIQHAGIVLGMGAHRTAGHSHYKMAKENLGYMGRLCYAQNVSAVTGACLMVKKKLFDEVGGLSEDLAVALNDVDFCLKLRKKGLLNVFTPFAELFHYESVSRGTDVTEEASRQNAERYNRECDLFKEKWRAELDKGDPYFNPNFSLDYSNFVLAGNPKSMVG
ncbi:MAG: glycosyltransferase family 2 protein [Lachnospiraceae bacterium]|jgi:GT2 family glycosyltransferase|nr:glycosyltransferase family 2 protein [Lachnospiraceae bacterium]